MCLRCFADLLVSTVAPARFVAASDVSGNGRSSATSVATGPSATPGRSGGVDMLPGSSDVEDMLLVRHLLVWFWPRDSDVAPWPVILPQLNAGENLITAFPAVLRASAHHVSYGCSWPTRVQSWSLHLLFYGV